MTDTKKTTIGIAGLSRPFRIDEVKFVVTNSNAKGIVFAPYIEKYDVFNRFNECLGHDSWSMRQDYLTGGYVKCTLSVSDHTLGIIVSRDGIGSGDAGDLKAADTDSVKRAATAFGVGNFPLKIMWPFFEEVQDKKTGKMKKIPTWHGNRIYGQEINKIIHSLMEGTGISPHDDTTHWINANGPSTKPTQATKPASSPIDTTKIEQLIYSAKNPHSFKTSMEMIAKAGPEHQSQLKTVWGDRVISFAEREDTEKEVIKDLGTLVSDVFGKENGYTSRLRGIYLKA